MGTSMEVNANTPMGMELQLYCTLDTATSTSMTPDTIVNGTGAADADVVVALGVELVLLVLLVLLGVVSLDGCTHWPFFTTKGLGHASTQN